MRPTSVTLTAVGVSAPIAVDYLQSPTNISISAIATGVVDYTVQHTFDNIFDSSYVAATGNWWDNDNANLVHATKSATGTYNAPIQASRLKLNNVQANGSVALTIIQGLVP